MALPLYIFDEDANKRAWRLSTVSATDSIYYQYNNTHDKVEEPASSDARSGPKRRGRSRSKSRRNRQVPPRSTVETAPPIPTKSAARSQTSVAHTPARPASSIYTQGSQRKKYPTIHKNGPDVDEENLLGISTVQSSAEKGGSLEATRPAPLPPWHPTNNPDGGRKAWLSVAGSWCGLFVSFGWISSIGIFQAYYQTHQLSHMSPAAISWICSLETFMMFAGGPVFGKIFDTYGVQPLLITGSCLHVLGLMLVSISSEYYQFVLTQGILSPLGASMIFYPSMANIATWFFKRKALAFGVMASGSSVGGIVLPIMVQRLLPLVGFGWSLRAAAFLILGLCVLANLTVTSRNKPVKKPLSFHEFVAPLGEMTYSLTVAGCFLFFVGMFLPFNFIVLQAVASGMSFRLAAYMPAVINGLSFFGRIGPGWIADQVGRYNVIIVMVLFCAVIDLALWIPANNNALIITYSALYGFGTGAFVSMSPALIAQITEKIENIGVRTGTYFAIVSCAALIGNPIGGVIIDKWHGEFLGVQIFTGCLHLGAVVFLVLARISQSGFVLRAKV